MEHLTEDVPAQEATEVMGDVVILGSGDTQVRAARVQLATELNDLRVVTASDPVSAARVGAELAVLFEMDPGDVRALVAAGPRRRIVVVTTDESSLGARRRLAAGADAVVSAHGWSLALAPVCRAVLAGHVCVPIGNRRSLELPALSLRERQVLALLADGLSTAQIAERLVLAPSTVKSHSASAFRRLGVNSRREAVALVLGHDDALRRMVLTAQRGHPQPFGAMRHAVR